MRLLVAFIGAALLAVTSLAALAQKAEMPSPMSFRIGDAWTWQQVDTRSRVLEGQLTRTAVNSNGVIMFSNGRMTVQVSQAFVGPPSAKSWREWPLEVGRKWKYEEDWTRPDGVSGRTEQNVEVVAFEEVVVPAGKYMAFKIEHRGFYRNSRGGQGRQHDTFWYAPEARADVKHIRDDGFNYYTRELTSLKPGEPSK